MRVLFSIKIHSNKHGEMETLTTTPVELEDIVFVEKVVAYSGEEGSEVYFDEFPIDLDYQVMDAREEVSDNEK